MPNPFAGWTAQQVAEHNRRVEMKTAKQHNSEACGEVTLAEGGSDKEDNSTHSSSPNAENVSLQHSFSPRLSTDEEKLNKTEKAFLTYMRLGGFDWIGVQNVTLKLADDVRYTVDFTAIRLGKLMAYEVKGFFRDDARVKIKVAARLFPWISFVIVRKTKDGWQYEDVKP